MKISSIMKKIALLMLLPFVYCCALAQPEKTPEQKKQEKYEKALTYVYNKQTLDSLADMQEKHGYLVIYDGWEYNLPIYTIDASKVYRVSIFNGPCKDSHSVIVITTQSTRLRMLNRQRALEAKNN